MKYNTSQHGLIDEFGIEHAVDMVTISKVSDVYTSHRTTVVCLSNVSRVTKESIAVATTEHMKESLIFPLITSIFCATDSLTQTWPVSLLKITPRSFFHFNMMI